MPGSCSFEEMLSAVADFKAPVSEPGGSMQQGMYTPKGERPLLLSSMYANCTLIFNFFVCVVMNSLGGQGKHLEIDKCLISLVPETLFILNTTELP